MNKDMIQTPMGTFQKLPGNWYLVISDTAMVLTGSQLTTLHKGDKIALNVAMVIQ